MAAHFEHDHREGEREADPEPTGHVRQLRVGLRLPGHHARLQGHPADRARPRFVPHDLRVHGAGVLCARGRGRHRDRLQRHAALGAGTRTGLADLGMHGTGVLRVVRPSDPDGVDGWACAGRRVLCRVGSEILQALRATEVVRRALVDEASHGVLGRDLHPAHGIQHLGRDDVLCHRRHWRVRLFHCYGLLGPGASPSSLVEADLLRVFGHGLELHLPAYCCGLLSNFRLHPAEQKT